MHKTILIYNPRCSKSREAEEILTAMGIKFDIVDYLKDGLKEKLLTHLPALLGMGLSDMVRKNESTYKELNLSDKKFSDKEWIQILQEHPVLLERPIFIYKDKAVIARPPDLVRSIL
jgi:arsenate reductase